MRLGPIIQSVLLPIVLGSLSAVVVSRVLSEEQHETEHARIVPVRVDQGTIDAEPPEGAFVDDLARRIAALEAQPESAGEHRLEDSVANPANLADPEVVGSNPLSHEDAIEAIRLHRDELEGLFQAESVDSTWGPNAQEGYAETLVHAREEGGFALEQIECRTTRCRAALRVSVGDRAAMDRAAQVVLHQQYPHNCTIHVYEVPEELGGDLRQLFVHWDCAEERTVPR